MVEEGRRFVRGKPKVGSTKFGQLITAAQTRQGKRWIDPAGQDQVQLWWQMVQQKGQTIVDQRLVNEVIIVEGKCEGMREHRKFVDEHRQDSLY